jgi:hypothetical protein
MEKWLQAELHTFRLREGQNILYVHLSCCIAHVVLRLNTGDRVPGTSQCLEITLLVS